MRALTTKMEKGYVYIPNIFETIINKYMKGEILVRNKVEISACNPRSIRAGTSKVSPVSTEILLAK